MPRRRSDPAKIEVAPWEIHQAVRSPPPCHVTTSRPPAAGYCPPRFRRLRSAHGGLDPQHANGSSGSTCRDLATASRAMARCFGPEPEASSQRPPLARFPKASPRHRKCPAPASIAAPAAPPAVEPCHRDRAVLHLIHEGLACSAFQSSGHHIDIKARQQRLRAVRHWCNRRCCPWPFQSPTTAARQSPEFPRSSPVSSGCHCRASGAVDRLKLAITLATPASIAAGIGRGHGSPCNCWRSSR